jgi:hypothetical protein
MSHVKHAVKQPDPYSTESIRANWPRMAVELRRFRDELRRCAHNQADAERLDIAILLADQRYQELDGEGWPP